MASRFTQIVAAIKDQLETNWPGNEIEFAEGRKELSRNQAPKRVVWVRTGGRTEPVDGIGPGVHTTEVAHADPQAKVTSAAILTDQYDVECWIWGPDEESADEIRVQIIRAAHNLGGGRSIEAGRWRDITEDQAVASDMNHGAKHEIDFVFKVPILDANETELVDLLHDDTTEVFVDGPIPKNPPALTSGPP